jgi:hypothetical protein
MSDPIEDLHHFSEGMSVNPLPASEVRRRGDRRRHRNHALAAVGALAVLAVVATPIAVVAQGGDRSAPGPANPSPTRTTEPGVSPHWLHEVPASFPLTEGLPATNASDGSPVTTTDRSGVADLTVCGVPAWSATRDQPAPALDVAGATYAGESEDARARTLAVYDDDRAAGRALAALRTALGDCPVDRSGGGAPQQYDVSDADAGEESFTFTQRSRDGAGFLGDLTAYQVVRVGNALYLAGYYGQGGGDQQVVDHTLQLMAVDSAPVVSDLCLFAAEPCGPGDPSEASGSGGPSAGATGGTGEAGVGAIPADFPILDG